jgi:hypothetical protein
MQFEASFRASEAGPAIAEIEINALLRVKFQRVLRKFRRELEMVQGFLHAKIATAKVWFSYFRI